MLSATLVLAQEAEPPLDPPDGSVPPASTSKSAEGKETPEPPAPASPAKADPRPQSSPDVFVPSESIS